MKKFLYKNNQHIAYAEYGNPAGFPLIVQHGMIASIRDGALFGNHLGAHARILCMARPGYGESSPITMESYKEWGNVVACFANELSLAAFDVFSSSAGAPYGYAIGCACPDAVRNMYVYSGMPAFYDQQVQANWPYPITRNMTRTESEKIAYDLFFANVPEAVLESDDVRDSMMNNCFGVAQDLRIRFENWGFELSEVKAKVYMQHSKEDEVLPVEMAVRTSHLLPDCTLELLDHGPHFSVASFQGFIEQTIIRHLGG